MNKWSFDKNYLRKAICNGKLILSKKNNSDTVISSINDEIAFFERCLVDDYSFNNESISNKAKSSNFSELKKNIMHEAKLCGSCFGKGYTDLISRLVECDIFLLQKDKDQLLSIDEQASVTLKTYEAYSPFFLDAAKKIILPEYSHIQVVDNHDFVSYSFGSTQILNESFVVLNPNEGNGILSYNVQEGIEDLYPLGYSLDHYELGPILFQLLFHDKLFLDRGIKYSTDYFKLITLFREKLIDILPVLKFYQVTRSYGANEIENDVFIELCNNYFGTDKLEEVYNYIHRILSNNDINFIFSVFYAIDAREKVIEQKIDAFKALENTNDDYLYTKDVIDKKYKVYQKYMDDIKSRCCK